MGKIPDKNPSIGAHGEPWPAARLDFVIEQLPEQFAGYQIAKEQVAQNPC
jgi:hypothetical protein